jgi:hemerythrin
MDILKWDDSLSVNIPEVDSEHKVLVKLINELHTATKEGKAQEATAKTLNELVQYTQTHFGHEEVFMTRNNYPAYAAHKVMHEAFVEKVAGFQKEFIAGKAALSLELFNFLRDWLVGHIKKADAEYGKALAGKKYP